MAKGSGQKSADGRSRLGGSLNPAWVELLMGWPKNWTCLEPMDAAEFSKWLNGQKKYWRDGSWEKDVPRIVTGMPYRTDRLKALGNGQVPTVVKAAWNELTGGS